MLLGLWVASCARAELKELSALVSPAMLMSGWANALAASSGAFCGNVVWNQLLRVCSDGRTPNALVKRSCWAEVVRNLTNSIVPPRLSLILGIPQQLVNTSVPLSPLGPAGSGCTL